MHRLSLSHILYITSICITFLRLITSSLSHTKISSLSFSHLHPQFRLGSVWEGFAWHCPHNTFIQTAKRRKRSFRKVNKTHLISCTANITHERIADITLNTRRLASDPCNALFLLLTTMFHRLLSSSFLELRLAVDAVLRLKGSGNLDYIQVNIHLINYSWGYAEDQLHRILERIIGRCNLFWYLSSLNIFTTIKPYIKVTKISFCLCFL